MEAARLTILVVDDDASLRLLCRVNFELEGFGVLEAATLAEARAALGHADIVLLDLGVASEDGRALLTDSKRECPERPVVLVTGSEVLDADTRALADGFVRKPFALAELVETVRRAAGVESPPAR